MTRSPRTSNAVSGVPAPLFLLAQNFTCIKKIQTIYDYFNERNGLLRKLYHSAEDYLLSFQNGQEEGFAWFFNELYPPLTYYCNKIIGNKEASEEIASNAFIKIWQRHEQFADAISIRKYLYRIVRNDALKHLRKQKQSAAVSKEVIYLYSNENEKDCFNSLVRAEVWREVLQAINSLPEECSKVFRLMYIEGKSIQETAEALHLSPSTVKTQKARGLKALRGKLPLPLQVCMAMFSTLFSGLP